MRKTGVNETCSRLFPANELHSGWFPIFNTGRWANLSEVKDSTVTGKGKILPYSMKTYGGGGIAPPFLTFALDGGERSVARPGRFTPRERSRGPHRIGGCMGPRAGLDSVVERKLVFPLLGIESRPSSP
jgi:hypothetical protein